MFFDLLSDQNNHYLTYYSSMMHPLMQQPSFDSDHSAIGDGSNGGQNRQQSSFKVLFKWRHEETIIKAAQFKKKISQIEAVMLEEQELLNQTRAEYDTLLNFMQKDPERLLEILKITPHIMTKKDYNEFMSSESIKQLPESAENSSRQHLSNRTHSDYYQQADPVRESLLGIK